MSPSDRLWGGAILLVGSLLPVGCMRTGFDRAVSNGDAAGAAQGDSDPTNASSVVYVSTAGASLNTGLSPESAKASIAEGLQVAQNMGLTAVVVTAGDFTLAAAEELALFSGLVLYGAYAADFLSRNPKDNRSRIIDTDGGSVFVADVGSDTWERAFVDGFIVDINTDDNGGEVSAALLVRGAVPLTVRNCGLYVQDHSAGAVGYGIRFDNPEAAASDVAIQDNLLLALSSNSQGILVQGVAATGRVVIERNEFLIQGSPADATAIGVVDSVGAVVIKNNVVMVLNNGYTAVVVQVKDSAATVINNSLRSGAGASGSPYGIFIDNEAAGSGHTVTIVNNILTGVIGRGTAVYKVGAGGLLDYHHNLAFDFAEEHNSNVTGHDNQFDNTNIKDIVFVNDDNCALADANALYAVDQGVDTSGVSLGAVEFDFLGIRRPQRAAYDLGACEKPP